MRKSTYKKLVQEFSLATYHKKIFETEGIQFRVGKIDSIINDNYLAVAVSSVDYDDGLNMAAIIVSKPDVKQLIEKCGKSKALSIIRFVIGHEVGHLNDWKLCSSKPGLILDEEKEVEADVYSIKHNNLSISEYRELINEILAGMEEAYDKRFRGVNKIIQKKIIREKFNKRMDNVSQLPEKPNGGNFEPIYKEVAELICKM